MEYFLGSLVTAITIFSLVIFFKNKFIATAAPGIRYSQSHVFNMVRPFIFAFNSRKMSTPKTQATTYKDSAFVRVVFTNNQAYWIKNNAFYTAELHRGVVDTKSTKLVDIMGMNDVQLKEAMLIVEKLTEKDI